MTIDGAVAPLALALVVLLLVCGVVTATEDTPQAPRVVVFRAPGFPTVDAPAIDDATLATALAPLPAETLDSAEALRAKLLPAGGASVRVLSYGSAFPVEAWPAIRDFVRGGGGLVVLGGAPFHQPVRRAASGRRRDALGRGRRGGAPAAGAAGRVVEIPVAALHARLALFERGVPGSSSSPPRARRSRTSRGILVPQRTRQRRGP